MSGTKHTPGPWTASDDRRGIWDILHDGDMLAQVWRVRVGMDGDLPAEANARLIAAAPDLLEALQNLLHETSDGCQPCGIDFVHAAHDAIAKATGQKAGVR